MAAAAVMAVIFIDQALAKERFVEIDIGNATSTYDIETAEIIQPGKFSIYYTSVSKPEAMRFRLALFDEFESACRKPAGAHPMGQRVLSMNKPDMPVEDIIVSVDGRGAKGLTWNKPYSSESYIDKDGKTKPGSEFAICSKDFFAAAREVERSGTRSKMVFDCKRYVIGLQDPRNNQIRIIDVNSSWAHTYKSVCKAVTGTEAYLP